MKKELLRELLETKQYKQLHALLMKESEVDIAYLLQQLELEECAIAFRLLSKKQAARVFSNMDIQRQKQLVELFSEIELIALVENQYMDDLVDLVEDLPANLVTRILNHASASQRQIINQLLSYPSESAGALMTTEFLSLKKEMTILEALNFIKEKGNHSKTVSTKDLLLNDEKTKIEEVMKENFTYVYTHTDQEEVAQVFRKYDLMVLPVVDDEKMLVGIVTGDDVMDVMVDETNEDISKMAALEPNDKSYFQTSVFEHAKHRIVWLLVLMFSATLTGSIITKYENAFQTVPLLVSFIPMLMDTGGNCGSQSSTLIIRGIALDEIRFKEIFKVMFKEFRIALLVGSILALANGIRIFLMYQDVNVALSLIVTVILSKLIGCILPLLANRVGLDPAIMASPLITTIVDTCSILVYFNVAMHIFNL